MTRATHALPIMLAGTTAIATFLACNRSQSTQHPTVAAATTSSAVASLDCTRPENTQPPVASSADTSHYNYAWWLTVRFTPVSDTIFSMPIGLVDSTWSKATVLTRDILPPQARDDPGVLADTAFGFCFDGDFNHDGRRDRAAVGVYRTHRGNLGRFLLILTQTDSGHWRTAFLVAVPGDPGFGLLAVSPTGDLGWWRCMECDNWTEVAWADGAYVLRAHAGGAEEGDSNLAPDSMPH